MRVRGGFEDLRAKPILLESVTIANLATQEIFLVGPGAIMTQPVHKIHFTEPSDMQLQYICT